MKSLGTVRVDSRRNQRMTAMMLTKVTAEPLSLLTVRLS
jgi:hypothetical protein